MARIQSWEVSDAFWKKVEPLITVPQRDPNKVYNAKLVVAESLYLHERYLKPLCMFSEPVANGKHCPKNGLAVPVLYILIFCAGWKQDFLFPSGEKVLQNMMRWRASLGDGKA